MSAPRIVVQFVLAAAMLVMSLPAAAQSTGAGAGSTARDGSNSWLSTGGRGYLGLNIGRSEYRLHCGFSALSCDDKDNAINLTAGAMGGSFWGAELGYINMGRATRFGGEVKAQGLNLSVVGRTPRVWSFGLFGKVGTTYGLTESSSATGSALASGSESGFGLSYGAGVSFDFTPNLSATLGWDSYDFRFAGGNRDPVRATTLGLQYRY